ncbi:MAG TPA: sugar ABC transporter substrate-binding protein, partial [Thermopolyspora sp.]
MRKGILSLAAAAAALSLGLTACGGNDGDTSAEQGSAAPSSAAAKVGKIGVILPDSKSSARWETADRKYLTEAFQAAGVEADIQNAQGDKNAFQTIAD